MLDSAAFFSNSFKLVGFELLYRSLIFSKACFLRSSSDVSDCISSSYQAFSFNFGWQTCGECLTFSMTFDLLPDIFSFFYLFFGFYLIALSIDDSSSSDESLDYCNFDTIRVSFGNIYQKLNLRS